MSLKDTIDGAMREAGAGGLNIPGSGQGVDAGASAEAEAPRRQARGSAASARPARERAGSVRVQTSSPDQGKNRALASKEEKKAIRQRERDKEDLLVATANALQKQDAAYQKSEHLFWAFMVIGFACTIVSMVLNYVEMPAGPLRDYQEPVSIVMLVLAYVFIIGSFVYDIVKRSPVRKQYSARAASMSDAKKRAVIEGDMEQEASKREARKKGSRTRG